MNRKQYAIFDQVASLFLNPVTFNTDAEAIRWFTTTINDTTNPTMVSLHPEGYTLYRLADYNDLTGTYQPRDIENNGEPSQDPKLIIQGTQVKDKETKLTLEDIQKLIQDISLPQNVQKIN